MQAVEATSPSGCNQLVLRAHPFTNETGVLPVAGGRTLLRMLQDAAGGAELRETLRVEIGGFEVPRTLWDKVKPKPGTAIHVTGMPAGGGGSGQKTLRTVLMIVVMVAAIYSGQWYAANGAAAFGMSAATIGTLIQAGVMMVGMLAVNALVPPPMPGEMKGSDGRWNALTGTSNQFVPYGPIPCVIGETRLFPPHAAVPYMETMGTDSYQRVMFDLGFGDLDVSDIRIGDTPLSSFEGVQYEVTKTPTLYTSDVQEEGLSIVLRDGDTDQRTTAPQTDEISLDIVFPGGLFGVNDEGTNRASNCFFNFEYRAVGASTWIQVTKEGSRRSALGYISNPDYTSLLEYQQHPFFCRRDDRRPFAASIAWAVARGQYEVRVNRYKTQWGGNGKEGSKIGVECQWGALRSIKATNPSTTGTTKLVMRIKASEQLNGTLQTLSCLVKQKIPVYNRATRTWSAPQPSTNPAWVYYWLLNACPAFATHVAPGRIDLDGVADYADFCTANSFECRGVIDARTTARAVLDDVLSCSLGTLSMRDGKYGVLFDDGSTVPTMAFSPLDSRNFRATRVFTRLPHALKVRFKNPEASWRMDEVIVLDDGYSFRGKDARGNVSSDPEPTEFETLELRMAADPIHAWRLGRAHFAQAKFRPNQYRWDTDVANLACTRGDLVHVAHDVMEWGAGWGRVVGLVPGGEGGAAATLTLDAYITTEAGKSYSVQLRRQDASAAVVACTPHSLETNTFYLASLPTGVAAGDMAIVGETTRVATPLLITGIQPQADLAARLMAVAYDARVAPYWAGPPAAIASEITGTNASEAPDPPTITVTVSDPINDTPDDNGNTAPEVFIQTTTVGGYVRPPLYTTQAL
jgi:hypothetical protein